MWKLETEVNIEPPEQEVFFNNLKIEKEIEDEINLNITHIIDSHSESRIVVCHNSKIWLKTDWSLVISSLQDVYAKIIDRLIYRPHMTQHANYIMDLIQMCKLAKNWYQENKFEIYLTCIS